MRTFPQWREDEILRRIKDYHCTRADADFWLCPENWWEQHIRPALHTGEAVSLPVARSIAKHGGGFSLGQISQHYEGQLPFVDFKTGILIPCRPHHWTTHLP